MNVPKFKFFSLGNRGKNAWLMMEASRTPTPEDGSETGSTSPRPPTSNESSRAGSEDVSDESDGLSEEVSDESETEERSEGSITPSEGRSEVSVTQSGERSEGSVTPTEGRSEGSVTPSEGRSEGSVTPSGERTEGSVTPSKERSEGSVTRSGESSDGSATLSGERTDRSETPLEGSGASNDAANPPERTSSTAAVQNQPGTSMTSPPQMAQQATSFIDRPYLFPRYMPLSAEHFFAHCQPRDHLIFHHNDFMIKMYNQLHPLSFGNQGVRDVVRDLYNHIISADMIFGDIARGKPILMSEMQQQVRDLGNIMHLNTLLPPPLMSTMPPPNPLKRKDAPTEVTYTSFEPKNIRLIAKF
ncbi:hypothetical protein B9Z55_022467 [Caenorhabditis nigoni]|uniref:Uncharacterized protein n=1 Tax=Caenorhabditis nigoni TaxID=1611254 RepID=A0A2G5SK80_9PELO|nr:hypothetical protein B9Z55_022467 [Caenorhabditis nigoni]